MGGVGQSIPDHKRPHRPRQAVHANLGSSADKSSIRQSDISEARPNSLADDDRPSVFFYESSQLLTSLCTKLQGAILVHSDAQEYRRTIQQSVEQGERLLQLFRSLREELVTLRYNATTDPLTGLKNRRTFEEHLVREISRCIRYRTSFALLLFDLRRFKLANDSYGHTVGDEILRTVARACLEATRASDICCRIGGDEFGILLPRADRLSAETLAARVARKFELYAKPLAPNAQLGIDYGIAVFPEDGDGTLKLFQNADKKLYENKQAASRLSKDHVVPNRAFVPAA